MDYVHENIRSNIMALCIVQFPHPGGDPGTDDPGGNIKSWNRSFTKSRKKIPHVRKFMIAPGSYVEEINGKEIYQQRDLFFWGEWEPPSKVHHLNRIQVQEEELYPQYLHKPYLPPPPFPQNTRDEKNPYQNTDPFVFGDSFRYAICRQRAGNIMTRLDKGSLILFGIGKEEKGKAPRFLLDTVFVVAGYRDYKDYSPNALHDKKLPKDISDIDAPQDEELYWDIVVKMACGPYPLNGSIIRRLYYGATYEKTYKGMYSFAPAHKYEGTVLGFPRVTLCLNSPYFTNNLTRNFKSSEVDSATIKAFWEEIREISRIQGCVEGVYFDMPSTIDTL
jgi:hypothetical protein